MAIRSTDSLLWSCAPDAPALSRCHLAVHKPTRIDWLCWNGIVVVVVVVVGGLMQHEHHSQGLTV